MTRTLFTILLFSTLQIGLFHAPILGQSSINIDSLQSVLTLQMRLGNRRALRDMAYFLDKPPFATVARRAIVAHTFFTPAEIDIINQMLKSSSKTADGGEGMDE